VHVRTFVTLSGDLSLLAIIYRLIVVEEPPDHQLLQHPSSSNETSSRAWKEDALETTTVDLKQQCAHASMYPGAPTAGQQRGRTIPVQQQHQQQQPGLLKSSLDVSLVKRSFERYKSLLMYPFCRSSGPIQEVRHSMDPI